MTVLASFTVDGIPFEVNTTGDDDISFRVPGFMNEEVHLSVASTNLLIHVLIAAVSDIEEGD